MLEQTQPENDLHPVTPTPTTRQKPSPVLLVFLILPVIMLGAAAVMMLSSTAAETAIPTPAAVTLPPIPTQVMLSNTSIIDFQLTTLDGEDVRLSDFKGRTVFLNFWQTTCIPCERELPTFQSFIAEQPDDGTVVLAVNVAENADTVRTYLQERGIGGLTVPMDSGSDVANSYGIWQIPVTMVIDADSMIRYTKYGEITRQDIDAYLELLADSA